MANGRLVVVVRPAAAGHERSYGALSDRSRWTFFVSAKAQAHLDFRTPRPLR